MAPAPSCHHVAWLESLRKSDMQSDLSPHRTTSSGPSIFLRKEVQVQFPVNSPRGVGAAGGRFGAGELGAAAAHGLRSETRAVLTTASAPRLAAGAPGIRHPRQLSPLHSPCGPRASKAALGCPLSVRLPLSPGSHVALGAFAGPSRYLHLGRGEPLCQEVPAQAGREGHSLPEVSPWGHAESLGTGKQPKPEWCPPSL